jgi:hypothetical protein
MSDPATTAKALRILADQIQAPDDVPACCLREAAEMVTRLAADVERLRGLLREVLPFVDHAHAQFVGYPDDLNDRISAEISKETKS